MSVNLLFVIFLLFAGPNISCAQGGEVEVGGARAIAFSPDNKFLAVSGIGCVSGVKIWDLNTWKLNQAISDENVESLSFSPDGKLLAMATIRGVEIRNVGKWDVVKVLSEKNEQIHSVMFSSDSKGVYSMDNSSLKLWRVNGSTPSVVFLGDAGYVVHVLVMSKSYLLSGSWSSAAKLLNTANGELIHTIFAGNTLGPTSLAISPDEKTIAVGYDHGRIDIYDANSNSLLRTLKSPSNTVNGMVFTRKSELISIAADSTIKMWNLKTGKCLKSIVLSEYAGRALALSIDGRYVAAVTDNLDIQLFDTRNLSLVKKLN